MQSTILKRRQNMDIVSSVAQTSMSLSAFKVQQSVDIAMLKKTMELQELEIECLLGKMPDITQAVGSIIDVRA